MSAVFTIAARELKERSRIFIAAVVLAILPFGVFLVPAFSQSRNDSLLMAAMIISVAAALGVAVTTGVTIIGRELSERRLAFYFSRPISSAALWAGKMLAGAVLILGTLLIISAPALFVAHASWSQYVAIDMTPAFGGVICLALLIFLIANVGSTLVRSRSAKLGIDALLLAVTLVVLALLTRALFIGQAYLLAQHTGLVVVTAIAALLAGAGWYQLRAGRVDRMASHAAVSRFVWSGMAVILLATTAFVFWVTHPEMSELRSARAVPIAEGRHAVIYGGTKGRGDYLAIFDYDLVSQRSVRLSANDPLARAVASSRDGSRIVYVEHNGNAPGSVTYLAKSTNIDKSVLLGSTSSMNRGVVLSDGGSRALLINGDVLSVIDCNNAHSVATTRVPGLNELGLLRAWFLDDAHLVIGGDLRSSRPATATVETTAHLFTWDIAANRVTPLTDVTNRGHGGIILASRNGRTALVRFSSDSETNVVVLDILTGREIGRIADPEWRGLPRFLMDGRIAAARVHGTDASIVIYSPAGAVVQTIPLGTWGTARITSQLSDGTLCVGVTHSTDQTAQLSTLAVDVQTGKVVREWKRFFGPYGSYAFYLDPRPLAGAPLYRDPLGHIAQLDLAGGRARVLTGPFDIDIARAMTEARSGILAQLQ